MKLRTAIYASVVASLLCASAQADWVNSLKPQGKPAGKVKVVKAGKPQGGIQLPDHPTPQETNAAAELQHWVKEMTGATLGIKSGKARGSCIVIRTDTSLGDEGYAIAVKPQPDHPLGRQDPGRHQRRLCAARRGPRLPLLCQRLHPPAKDEHAGDRPGRPPLHPATEDPRPVLRLRLRPGLVAAQPRQCAQRRRARGTRRPHGLRRHVRPHAGADCAAGQILQGAPGLLCAAGRRHAHHRPALLHAPRGGEDRN